MNAPHVLALQLTSKRPIPKVGRFRWSAGEGRLIWADERGTPMVFRSLEEVAPEIERATEHLRELDNITVRLQLVPAKAESGNRRPESEPPKAGPVPPNGQDTHEKPPFSLAQLDPLGLDTPGPDVPAGGSDPSTGSGETGALPSNASTANPSRSSPSPGGFGGPGSAEQGPVRRVIRTPRAPATP